MKLHIFGAAGAGVTTLGQALAAAESWPYFDTDDYFWLPTPAPFTARRALAERNARLAADLAPLTRAVVGGSLVGWGNEWTTRFDAAVFLYLPPALRLARLRAREHARYGDAIRDNPARATQYAAFLEWAAGYDDGSSGGHRTLANHENWLREFRGPTLALHGDQTVAQRVAAVQAWLATIRT